MAEYAEVIARPNFSFGAEEIAAALAMFDESASWWRRATPRPYFPISTTANSFTARKPQVLASGTLRALIVRGAH